MFDLGWSELAVIALIALIVVGPKELPQILRTAAHWMRKARSMAREFQSSVDEMVREAELDEAKKTMESVRHMNLDKQIEETIDPTGSVKDEVAELGSGVRRGELTEGEVPPEFQDLDSGAPEDGQAQSTAKGTTKGATVIEQPAQPAPPHSSAPPEEAPPVAPKTAAPKTAASKTAASKTAAPKASGAKASASKGPSKSRKKSA